MTYLKKKPDEFDVSIFDIKKLQEIFTDKTVISNALNSLFKALYSFYISPNFSAIIKIKNVHIRFEDDELMNYTGDIAYGLKVDLIQIKVGSRGNMKKDAIKLEKLNIYWENDAKILIASNFLNSCIEDGKLQERYYTNLKTVKFEKFQYFENTKFIINDFNFSINLGTKSEKTGDLDIFHLKTPPSMVYFQLASNEININLYPDFIKVLNNFNEFLSQFPIIDKVKDYRPFIKPTEENSMNYINLMENYRKNVIDNKNKKKMLVRDWINYFYWFQKSKNGEKIKIINPLRTEFVRFYNICIKKMDIHKKEEIKNEKNEKNKNPSTAPPTPSGNETPKEEEKIIPKDFDFSSRIDLLIKGLHLKMYTNLEEIKRDYISLKINGIEIKIKLSKEKFEFFFKVKTFDLGPSNLTLGERVILQPKSYRKSIQGQYMTSLKSNIPYSNLSTYNYVTLPNSELGSNISGLIKKYNPNHEEQIKVIDEALELAQSQSRIVSIPGSEIGDMNKFRGPRIKNKTPFGDNDPNEGTLGHSVMNLNININDLGKTYGAVVVPRNVSFAKNLIDGYETNSLQNKIYERKKMKEMNISQAVNDYNSYKIFKNSRNSFRFSKSPPPLMHKTTFNLRESEFGITPNGIRGRNVPLNLLEIFSNTAIGALSLKFTKYNNPITIDNLSIQIGTIRLNFFVNYLLDILRILSDYQKATNIPQIAKSQEFAGVDGKTLLQVQEYIYKYILEKIPAKDITESIIEYREYLRKQISSKKKFSTKPEHFALNQIFSIFPKGFDFHFDNENIELVAYDKNNTVSNKISIPTNEFIFGINFTKIFVKLLDLEIEIDDLNKCESIIEQLKSLAEDKFKVIKIVLEPCYKEIKDGIEPLIQDIKDQNNKYNLNKNNKEDELILKKKEEEKRQKEQLLINKQKEKELMDLMIKNQKENELLIKKQKEQEQLILMQNQQKKNQIPKIPLTTNNNLNINYVNNNFDEIPKMPRDTVRSKKDENNLSQNNQPKMESGSSYELLKNDVVNYNEEINDNYNSNYDINKNNYNNYVLPNMNDVELNQQYNLFSNEVGNDNNFGYK